MNHRVISIQLLLALLTCPAYAQAPSFSRLDSSSVAGARAIAAADFNRDGWPDVAHANTGRDTVTILLNGRNGGSLVQTADIAVGHGPFDLVTADFNRDGNPDLAVANADDDTISILIGDGSGAFSRSNVAAPGNPRGITAADINRDGRPDIVYTAFLQNRVQVLTGNGAGGFAVGSSVVGVANFPQGVAAIDFNHDGRMDLAVAYASAGGGVALLYGNASGTFAIQPLPGEQNLNVVTGVDLNHDSWPDLAAASTGNNRLAVYYGGPEGVQYDATYLTGASPRDVAAADFNHDGLVDLATANREGNTVSIFTAQSSPAGTFDSFEVAAGAGSRGLAAADFDHDSLVDLATGNQDAPSVTVLWNVTQLSRAGFAFRTLDGSNGFDRFPDEVVLGDFDEDGWLDRINTAGTIEFGNGTTGQVPRAIGYVQVADVNGDGHADLVFSKGDRMGTLLGNGHGGFTDGADAGGGWVGTLSAVRTADVDRDGDMDIVATGFSCCWENTHGFLQVAKGNGDGTFAAPVSREITPTNWIELADVDGDARLDLISHSQSDRRLLLVEYGDGTGAFAPGNEIAIGLGLTGAHVADLNHDGRPDIVVGSFDGTHVLLGIGGREFAPAGTYTDTSYKVSLGDLDNDGNLDLVGTSAVRVSFGRADGTFGPSLGFASYANDPLVADMNNDGLTDIVAGDGPAVLLNVLRDTNTPPTVAAPEDLTVSYADTFNDDEENIIYLLAAGSDADLHMLRYEWRDAEGNLLRSDGSPYLRLPMWNPGSYQLTVTAFDDRGGSATDTMTLTIEPLKEIVLYAIRGNRFGDWEDVSDPEAALGWRKFNPDRGRAKVTAPLASPDDYFELVFLADPTQDYKLWIRGKAVNDYWGNDSAWVQFEHSLNRSGAAAYRIGTADALPFNLEECSGCGISGWGWEDDGWGAVNTNGTTIRFEQGGWQRLRIQRREDGLSIDQIVLSSERYLTARPGTAKNDTTIVPEPRR